jgi:hypothetical protein
MAEILQTFTLVRKLFLPDVVPWPYLLPESNQEKLRVRYKMTQLTAATDPSTGAVARLFSPLGEFNVEKTSFLIEQLTIEPLAIQFQISGDTDLARKFGEDLGSFFLEVDPAKKYSGSRELTTTYQTIAIVNFGFSCDALFSRSFGQYLDEVMPELKLPDADVEIRLNNIRWTVIYKPHTADYTYLPKPFVIEPRQGSRPKDHLYFTQSPTDFLTHKKLIESLEKALMEK